MQSFVKYITRAFFIIAWMGLIYLFLILPKFFTLKDDQVKTLRVYTWANRIDESIIRQFEQETDIKIYLNYYDSGEELLTKIEKTSTLDCDIMIPSAHTLEKMIEKQLVKKIDKNKCTFMQEIYPEFLNFYFDPNNDYSIPIFWDIFGIGYNSKIFKGIEITT